jgi:hypothetical protein
VTSADELCNKQLNTAALASVWLQGREWAPNSAAQATPVPADSPESSETSSRNSPQITMLESQQDKHPARYQDPTKASRNKALPRKSKPLYPRTPKKALGNYKQKKSGQIKSTKMATKKSPAKVNYAVLRIQNKKKKKAMVSIYLLSYMYEPRLICDFRSYIMNRDCRMQSQNSYLHSVRV